MPADKGFDATLVIDGSPSSAVRWPTCRFPGPSLSPCQQGESGQNAPLNLAPPLASSGSRILPDWLKPFGCTDATIYPAIAANI
jgi:hypothetical protein